MSKHRLYFYDFEVFTKAKWWMVVFIDYETKEEFIIIDDKKELTNFHKEHIDDIFVGYNSRGYDQWILKSILLNKCPFKMTEHIIEKGKPPYQLLRNAKDVKLNNFDVSNIMNSLKQLEGFMGSMIKESSVPFDLDRELTDDEIKETIDYCRHDVLETMKVFEYKKETFDSQLLLIETFDLGMDMFNKTGAQLSSHILGTVRQSSIDDEFDFSFPTTLRLNKYKYIEEWYRNPRNHTYNRKLEVEVAGCPTTFAYGGVHGAKLNCARQGIILCFDVASLYPSLMILYDCLSRNVLKAEKYSEIKKRRLAFKKAKDRRQIALKLVLNATYGILKDPNNPFFDPRMSNQVCVSGQLLLLDLVEKVEHLGETLQVNTDGVYMYVENMDKVEEIKILAKEWEDRTGLDLEWDIYSKIYQRDVNNYIIVDENNKYKSKGCVKKKTPIDNDLGIITKAIIDNCVFGTSVEDTINSCDELIEFQKIVKVTGLYKYAYYGSVKQEEILKDGKKTKVTMEDKGEVIKEKVLRVFASTDKDAQGVYKVKSEIKVEKMASTPDKCFINNENIVGVKCPDNLDKDYYIELAKDRLKDFLGENDVVREIKKSNTDQLLEYLNKNHCSLYDLLVDIKVNTKLTPLILNKYVIIDAFKNYGKVYKVSKYMELFKSLYGKKNLTDKSAAKITNDIEIIEILKRNSSYDEVKGKYTDLNSEQALKNIWEYLPNTDIHISYKIRQEFDMFDECTIHDNSVDESILYIMNVNQTKNPSVIGYSVKHGLTNIFKIPKEVFKILEIRPGDFIKCDKFEIKPKVKVIGKDEEGINIIGESDVKEWWISQYKVVDRDYNKNGNLIVDCEMEVI